MSSELRHARQVRFANIGSGGQASLSASRVLIVGLGALGSHCANWLCRAGVGTLYLVDRDIVELQNLQRQVLYESTDAKHGTAKALAAARHLHAIDPEVTTVPLAAEFTLDLFEQLPQRPDLILDGTDNFATRYLINDLAMRAQIPWIYGGVLGSHGSAAVIRPGVTPCLRCWLGDVDASRQGTCETVGILATAAAAIAGFQTTQAIKILTGQAHTVANGIYEVDVWTGHSAFRLTQAKANPQCESCAGKGPALRASPVQVTALCGTRTVQVRPPQIAPIDLHGLAQRLTGTVRDLAVDRTTVRFHADAVSFIVFADGRALLQGLDDQSRALALYDRWLGMR